MAAKPVLRLAVAQRMGAKTHAVVGDPSPYVQDVACGRKIVQFDEVRALEAEDLRDGDWCPACERAFRSWGGVPALEALEAERKAALVAAAHARRLARQSA